MRLKGLWKKKIHIIIVVIVLILGAIIFNVFAITKWQSHGSNKNSEQTKRNLAIVDRIENNCAVCELEDNTIINIRLSNMPRGIKEGDSVAITNNGVTIDNKKTKFLKNEVEKTMNYLWK